MRFCKDRGLSYPTLRRWFWAEPVKPVQFVEIGEADTGGGRFSVALPNGLWAEFPLSTNKSVVASWIRELKAG